MIGYTASWVLPISEPPIRQGWVAVDGGRIVARGTAVERPAGVSWSERGDAVLMPGLVNAHTHLELSHLRGVISPAPDFLSWVRPLIARRGQDDPNDPTRMAAVSAAIEGGLADARRFGTALVGDIGNSLASFEPLSRSPLAGVVFLELLGFNVPDPKRLVASAAERIGALAQTATARLSIAAHAPYSVAPALYGEIRKLAERSLRQPYSVHLAESPEEVEFVRSGLGPWRAMLEQIGVWNAEWQPPRTSPAEYLDREGFLSSHTVAAHGVQMSDADLRLLRARGTTLVTCPRSNHYVGVGWPPVERFFASGVRVAVGTDSLASVEDLNLFSELAALRRLAPSVSAGRLLESATRVGAEALGFGADYGTLDPGRRAEIVAVQLPGGLERAADVEEYLVSGIAPDRVTWLPC